MPSGMHPSGTASRYPNLTLYPLSGSNRYFGDFKSPASAIGLRGQTTLGKCDAVGYSPEGSTIITTSGRFLASYNVPVPQASLGADRNGGGI